MRDSLAHRGPDDQGLFIDKNIGLGHRRLSILDVSAADTNLSCLMIQDI
jgi:asparagine synthase (glutamine-hydrolysing)